MNKGLRNVLINAQLNDCCACGLDTALGEADPFLVFAFIGVRAVILWNKLNLYDRPASLKICQHIGRATLVRIDQNCDGADVALGK